jgi:membrane dipeptidase
MKAFPIIDLHCDLPSYLMMGGNRSPHDPDSRSAYDQLHQGNVRLQVQAIFSTTGSGSSQRGLSQVKLFNKLIEEYPAHFTLFSSLQDVQQETAQIPIIAAIENGSAFAEENEPLLTSLDRLEQFHRMLKRILYITMTWDGENRFGGGVGSSHGLKNDGKTLLDWMAGKQIAIDFSHTSDKLAEEILTHLDQEKLSIPVIASHSNFRAISNYPRNLPDWLAQEIIRRQGLIGLNLFAPFIRIDDPNALIRHVEYGLSLGAYDALCFGADFFCDRDFKTIKEKYQTEIAYFPEYPNASCYPSILEIFAYQLSLSEEQLNQIGSGNVLSFLKRNGFKEGSDHCTSLQSPEIVKS